MANVILGVTNILARSGSEAAIRMEQGGYQLLLLDFPAQMQSAVDLIRSGSPPELGAEVARGLFGALTESWLYRNRYIIDALPRVPPEARVVCIGDEADERQLIDQKVSISLLEYRSLAGRIDPSRWRRELERVVMSESEVARRYSARLLRELEGQQNCLCVLGPWGRKLEEDVERRGHACQVVVFGQPYLGTPLEVLMSEIASGDVSDERIHFLVELHLDFFRRYLTVSRNVDEAYDRWLSEGQWVKLLKASG